MSTTRVSHIGFVGTLQGVSDDGSYGFIGAGTIERPDGAALGVTFTQDVYVHRRDTPTIRQLANGMRVEFYTAPNVRRAGQLCAVVVQSFHGRVPT